MSTQNMMGRGQKDGLEALQGNLRPTRFATGPPMSSAKQTISPRTRSNHKSAKATTDGASHKPNTRSENSLDMKMMRAVFSFTRRAVQNSREQGM